MTKRDVASVVCRVLGLVLAIWAIDAIFALLMQGAGLLSELVRGADGSDRSYALLVFGAATLVPLAKAVLYGALAWFALFRTDRMARWLAPGSPDAVVSTRLTVDELLTAAFAVVGVVLIGLGGVKLADAGADLAQRRAYAEAQTGWPHPTLYEWRGFAAGGVELIFGLALLLWPRGFVGLWRALRAAGGDSARPASSHE